MKNVLIKIIMPAALFFSAALTAAAAPKSEALFDKLVKTYILNPDGSQKLRVQKQLTIYTHAAMNSLYGETFIVYDPAYQHLKVNESYTRQADGTIVETPANAFVEVLPSAAANTPAYNGLREMVIVHTGLELGATIYLDYTLTTDAGALPALDIFEQVEELSPIKEYRLSVTVPVDTPLHYELLNGKASPKITDAEGMRTVTWELRNVMPRPASLPVSVPAGSVQAFAVTTYPSRQAALDVMASQVYSPDDDAVRALLDSFDSGKADRRSDVDKIHEYIHSGLATCGLTPAMTGYRVRPAAEVIKSAYATDAEKTLLANALLRASGMDSEVLLAFPKAADPASTGLASVQNIMATGLVDAADDATEDIGAYLSISGLDGRIVDPQSRPTTIVSVTELSVTASGGRELGGGMLSYSLPDAESGWIKDVYPSTVANTVRSVNLLLPYLSDETYRCTLRIEDGLKPVILPESVHITNSVGSVAVEVGSAGGDTVITRRLSIVRQLVTPELYPEYYRLMSEWYTISSSPLIFSAE